MVCPECGGDALIQEKSFDYIITCCNDCDYSNVEVLDETEEDKDELSKMQQKGDGI